MRETEANTKKNEENGIVNGVDAAALNQLVEAVKERPKIAQATFSVQSELETGFKTRTRTATPTLGGGEIEGRTHTFWFEGGHPPELLGHDEGPASVESLLAALGECVSGGFTTYGAAMGIPIERVTMELTGYLDLQGMLHLPEPGVVRPGFERIHAKIRVKSDAPLEQLEELKQVAEAGSPVKDSLRAVTYTSELVVDQ
jgi:uncharacterized OsmC-like protein